MSAYNCIFERVGRNHNVPTLYVEGSDPDEIAYHVYGYARKYLASNDVEVSVNLDTLRGFINYGRFGTFELVPV